MAKDFVICHQCGKEFLKERKEINRAIARGMLHFCSLSCAATFGNQKKKIPLVSKVCPQCNEVFVTKDNAKGATFCSASCASLGSMSEYRRSAMRESGYIHGNNLTVAAGLKAREGWKYVEIKAALAGIEHEFEYALGGYVFDLMILHPKILIEFDGEYHRLEKQIAKDNKKDVTALSYGFIVYRVAVKESTVISPLFLNEILTKKDE